MISNAQRTDIQSGNLTAASPNTLFIKYKFAKFKIGIDVVYNAMYALQ